MKTKQLFSCLFLLLCSVTTYAYDACINGIYYNFFYDWNIESDAAEVTFENDSFNSYSGDVEIPESVEYNGITYSVTRIGYQAFYDCYALTSVIIPNSVTTINSWAFCGSINLTSITIPSSVKTIESSQYPAFQYCDRLSNIYIDDIAAWINIAEFVNHDEIHLYLNGEEIKDLVIPTGVTKIGKNAFYNCRSLTSVTIPESVKSIDQGAFNLCWRLTKAEFASIEHLCNIYFHSQNANPLSLAKHLYINGEEVTEVSIPETVTSIGQYAFINCSGLTSVTIPNSVTSIGEEAFDNTACYNNQPEGLVYIGKWAYKYKGTMPSNTQIVLEEGTLGIAEEAFYGCSGLTSVTIPEGVTSINTRAFCSCSGLTSVNIPNSVTSIGWDAFRGCTGLTKAEFASIEQLCNIKFGQPIDYYSDFSNPLVYAHHLFINGEEITEAVIPNSVTSIGNFAFDGCSELTSVSIPNSVTSIGKHAFLDCTGLNKVEFSSIEQLCNIIFDRTDSNPLYYAHHLFVNGEEVTEAVIPNSVTSIGTYAFSGCSGLTSITIPNSVTSIGNYAFWGCSGLTSITFPNSVTSIEDDAFRDCSALTNVKVDRKTPPSIYSYTFTNRTNANLYVPAGSAATYRARSYWRDFKEVIEYIDGDVNGDGESDVVDVVDIARYVVGTAAETFVPILADINNNGEVNIADAVCLVNDIAGDQNFAKPMRAPSKPETTSDALMLTEGSNGLSLLLENQRDYTAFQFDLYVPEGVDVMQMMLNAQRKQKHQLLYNKVEEGHWRVAALSTSNRTFADNSGELLSFTLAGNANGDVVVSDIHFFTPNGEDCTFNDIRLQAGIVTDIQTAGNPQQTTDHPDVYDLSGRKIENSKWSNRQLPKGIYIVNGKKVIIK